MSAEPFGELNAPSAGLLGEESSSAPGWAQLITLLWALSRARTGKVETARYRKARGEIRDCLADYWSSSGPEQSVDLAATWLSMGRSPWWSTDLRPGSGATPRDVEDYNSTGGLSPAALAVALDEESCGQAVLDIVQNLPYSPGLEQLLAVLLFDSFVKFVSAETTANEVLHWYGLMDAEKATGSHDLADAASEGRWDEVVELLDDHAAIGAELVNTWRPGGASWSTPLHQAARQGAPYETVQALLDRGAWLNLPDAYGLLPLDYAVRGGHTELYEQLTPREASALELALNRALEQKAADAIRLLCTESSLLRVPRFRPPPVAVLRDLGGPLVFDLGDGQLVLHIWVEGDEMFIAYWWDESKTDGSVYIIGPEGERRDAPWDGSSSEMREGVSEGDREESEPSIEDEGEVELPHNSESPRYAGQRILVGTSPRFGPFYVLGPRSKREEILRRPEARSRSLGILVRRTGEECSWAVLGRSWRHNLATYESLVGAEAWTDLVLFCALFKRNALSDRLASMADFWARTGRDPLAEPEFMSSMREGLDESDVNAIVDRWRPFAKSMRTHRLSPSGTFAIGHSWHDEGGEPGSASFTAGSTSKKGRSTTFETGLPMSLRTMTSDAQGRWDGQSMLVLAGSRAALAAQPGFDGGYAVLRRQLQESGKLAREGNFLVFTQDHRFDAPSGAASVICGSSQNGREIWFDSAGRNINTIEGGVKYVRTR